MSNRDEFSPKTKYAVAACRHRSLSVPGHWPPIVNRSGRQAICPELPAEYASGHFLSKFFCSPGHEIANEQIEPLTDNKTVRLPGAAPGWTSPLRRRRSGAKRRTRVRRPRSNPYGALHVGADPRFFAQFPVFVIGGAQGFLYSTFRSLTDFTTSSRQNGSDSSVVPRQASQSALPQFLEPD
jgi:hypothetical protein